MRITRAALLRGGAAMLAMPAQAQDAAFPSQPIRMIVGYAPGGNTDVPARLFSTELARILGQPVVVENRPGASGVPAGQFVQRARPDGHMLLWATSASHSVSVVAMAPLAYDPVKDFTPITLISLDPNVIVSGPDFPARDLAGLLAHLRANPGTPIGTSGPATSGRFAAELMRPKLGIQLTPVPYRSTGPMLTDLAGGTLPLGIMGASTAVPFLRDGRLRAYGVTSLARSRILPQVPTFHEKVSPGFEAVAWSALYGPPGMAPAVVQRIGAAMREAAEVPGVKHWLDESGLLVPLGSPAELVRFMAEDIAKWVGVARDNNLRFENN